MGQKKEDVGGPLEEEAVERDGPAIGASCVLNYSVFAESPNVLLSLRLFAAFVDLLAAWVLVFLTC